MANQTLPLDVSYEYEMNKNKTGQCDGEKSMEENIFNTIINSLYSIKFIWYSL